MRQSGCPCPAPRSTLNGHLANGPSIVLTGEQLVTAAGNSTARGAMLQLLMVTRHLLVVGATFSDDNLLRLRFEVKQLRRGHDGHPIGTVVNVVPDRARAKLVAGDFHFHPVTDQENVDGVASRALEIELDRIGTFACADASSLASPDFTGMLNLREQAVAQQMRDLAATIDGLDKGERFVDGWRLVREQLTSFGAPRP